MLDVFTGDDWDITITLSKDNAPYDVSTATEILGSIVDSDGGDPQVILGPIAADSGAEGADWANGVVVLEFPNGSTAGLNPSQAWVEIQVTLDSKKTTWPRPQITIKKGTIA